MKKYLEKNWDLNNISLARNTIFGIATLWIILFHSSYLNFSDIYLVGNYVEYLRVIGNIGVDIFLFLSGVGLFFSYTKDKNVLRFYKRRVSRIFPAVLIVSIIWYGFSGTKRLSAFLCKILLLNFFKEGDCSFWFFSLLLILYIIYPILHYFVEKKGLVGSIILIILSLVLSFLMRELIPQRFEQIEVALTRIPIFIIGILLGEKIKSHRKIPQWTFILIFISSIVLIYILKYINLPNNYRFVYRYIFFPLAIELVFLFSFLYSKFKLLFSRKIFIYLGKYSMEMYLIYEKMYIKCGKIFNVSDHFGISYTIIIFTISFLLSFFLKSICVEINKNMS